MNFLLYILAMLSGLFAGDLQTDQAEFQGTVVKQGSSNHDLTLGVDRINVNPRTVVVLEDTHFKPDN